MSGYQRHYLVVGGEYAYVNLESSYDVAKEHSDTLDLVVPLDIPKSLFKARTLLAYGSHRISALWSPPPEYYESVPKGFRRFWLSISGADTVNIYIGAAEAWYHVLDSREMERIVPIDIPIWVFRCT